MAKTSGHEELGTALPEELRNLISRKLELRRREQLQVYMAANQFARLKMRNDMMTEIGAKRLGDALISIPLSTFREKVDRATAITRSWPGIVWECITSVLNK